MRVEIKKERVVRTSTDIYLCRGKNLPAICVVHTDSGKYLCSEENLESVKMQLWNDEIDFHRKLAKNRIETKWKFKSILRKIIFRLSRLGA